jgi:hypothetical protein
MKIIHNYLSIYRPMIGHPTKMSSYLNKIFKRMFRPGISRDLYLGVKTVEVSGFAPAFFRPVYANCGSWHSLFQRPFDNQADQRTHAPLVFMPEVCLSGHA